MYTLKLDLSEYERGVLVELLTNDRRRSEREDTLDSPWAAAVARILTEIAGYEQAVAGNAENRYRRLRPYAEQPLYSTPPEQRQ